MFGSKSKIFFTIGLIIVFIALILGLFFMTQYANVHVFYSFDEEKNLTIASGSTLIVGGDKITNASLFKYFTKSTDIPSSITGFDDVDQVEESLKNIVYNFQLTASKFNDLIIIFFLVGLICLGSLYLFDNHKRSTYYISNLVIGIISPITMIIFSIVMIVKDLSLIQNFENNKELYKIVSVMQDPSRKKIEKDALINGSYADIAKKATNVNTATMWMGIVIFGVIALYFTFILVFTLLKYKATSKARKETIERAVSLND